jgi:hypothetical protein
LHKITFVAQIAAFLASPAEAKAVALDVLRQVDLEDKLHAFSRAAVRGSAAARRDRPRAGDEAAADASTRSRPRSIRSWSGKW